MRTWLVRGSVFAVLNAVAQTGLAAVTVYHADTLTWLRPLTLGVLAGAGVLWGAVDAWFRRLDRGINWVKAAVLAGLLAGVLAVIGRAAFVDETGTWALQDALTGGAAFTALLVLIPAGLGLLLGLLLEPHTAAEDRRKKPATARSTAGDGATTRSSGDATKIAGTRPAPRARHRRSGPPPRPAGAAQPRSEDRSAPTG